MHTLPTSPQSQHSKNNSIFSTLKYVSLITFPFIQKLWLWHCCGGRFRNYTLFWKFVRHPRDGVRIKKSIGSYRSTLRVARGCKTLRFSGWFAINLNCFIRICRDGVTFDHGIFYDLLILFSLTLKLPDLTNFR